MKLSPTQLALLRECVNYKIDSDTVKKRYYRLGGSGRSPVRYNSNTIYILRDLGLVEYNGYWTATENGKNFIASL